MRDAEQDAREPEAVRRPVHALRGDRLEVEELDRVRLASQSVSLQHSTGETRRTQTSAS
jgi:hypothetical protein